jgi:predicted ATPase
VVVLHGPAEVGKSALAIHASHLVKDHFPDGQFYLDLSAPDADPVGHMLRALGLRPELVPPDGPEASARLRTMLADRRVLVVLEQAAGAEMISCCLPAGVGCATIMTTRSPITLGCRTVHIGVSRPVPQRDLFRARHGDRMLPVRVGG